MLKGLLALPKQLAPVHLSDAAATHRSVDRAISDWDRAVPPRSTAPLDPTSHWA